MAGLALDATNAYWEESGGSVIVAVPLVGGAVVTLVTGANAASSLTVDATNLYWLDASGATHTLAVSDGGAPVPVPGHGSPSDIVVNDTALYWLNGAGWVMQQPLDGGAASTMAGPFFPETVSMAADSENVYFGGQAQGLVVEMPLPSAGSYYIQGNRVAPTSIAVDSTSTIYWTDQFAQQDTVQKELFPQEPVSTLATNQTNPMSITLAPDAVYWTNVVPGSSAVMKLVVDAGAPTPIIANLSSPTSMEIAGDSVYVLDTGAGELVKITPR
jgi:hypothetical protein